MRLLFIILFTIFFTSTIQAQEHSVARHWNEALLEAIRNDFARPTVHGRNLFHTSVALYDSWAMFDPTAEPYMLGKTVNGFTCPFNGINTPVNIQAAQKETMSYTAYRLLSHRFSNSPGAVDSQYRFDTLMTYLGLDINFASTDYSTGSYAALGNYFGEQIIAFGYQDGSNETEDYANEYYAPVNSSLLPMLGGNPDIADPNRWQPLTLQVFIDQSGNVYPINTPEFLGPEWGEVKAFALDPTDLDVNTRDGYDYQVYHDPGAPPYWDSIVGSQEVQNYMWGFEMVSIWSSHLDKDDSTVWDISPGSIGNIQYYPTSANQFPHFYNFIDGGDVSEGHTLNPATGQSYVPQYVKRGDYARILAEFWADGPESETPPGHWFTILNYVSDHPSLEKRFRGIGDILPDLEWDVKSYFTLSGAMHDAAVTAWGVKGWYDYTRPISAIRYMADLGQSTDTNYLSYHSGGLPLVEDYVAVVNLGDELAGSSNENVGKIKLYAWKGPSYINDPLVDEAGVDWILAEDWWPYQRPSFVTPPFAGYVSGHSTFSRAAAEVLTALTGDPFFPGGMGEFHAPADEFLVFEDGPSEDVVLQWATYRDASDQCSLSRIWGGIHPPADDIPGRLMGIEIGVDAFELAEEYFEGNQIITSLPALDSEMLGIYPNPSTDGLVKINLNSDADKVSVKVLDSAGRLLRSKQLSTNGKTRVVQLDLRTLSGGLYFVMVESGTRTTTQRLSIVR
jgi:hypothetical protein